VNNSLNFRPSAQEWSFIVQKTHEGFDTKASILHHALRLWMESSHWKKDDHASKTIDHDIQVIMGQIVALHNERETNGMMTSAYHRMAQEYQNWIVTRYPSLSSLSIEDFIDHCLQGDLQDQVEEEK